MIFEFVIPKEGLPVTSLAKSNLGVTLTIKYDPSRKQCNLIGHKQDWSSNQKKRIGLAGASHW